MKIIINKASLGLLFVVLCFQLKAQDPIFSQFYSSPIYINPALAGSSECGRLAVNYRNQWSAIPGAFSIINASYDQYFDELSGALGLIVTSNREGNGTYMTTGVAGVYSYSLQVNDVFSIRAGLQAGFVNSYVDWNNLTFANQFNNQGFIPNSQGETNLPNTPTSKNYEDFSAGVVGYSENFYAGFSVHHLTRPNQSFLNTYKLPMKYTIHAGAVIDLKQKQKRFRDPEAPTLSPNIIYQQQGTSKQLNYGLYANFHPIVFGCWLRQNIGFKEMESATLLAGFQTDKIRIGYSFDMSLTKLHRVSGGSHELSLIYSFPCREKKSSKYKPIKCPSF